MTAKNGKWRALIKGQRLYLGSDISQSGKLKDSSGTWTKRLYFGSEIAQSGELKDSTSTRTKRLYLGPENAQSGELEESAGAWGSEIAQSGKWRAPNNYPPRKKSSLGQEPKFPRI